MKNVLKTAVVLFTALSFSFANAGELTVTGNAKASYVIISSDSTTGVLKSNQILLVFQMNSI